MEKIIYPKEPNIIEKLDNLVFFKENWDFTYEKLNKINGTLNTHLDDDSISIVIAGSYGRMEANSESDLDYMILTNDSQDSKIADIKKILEEVIKENNILLPNDKGVFSQTLTIDEISNQIGHTNDDLTRLAQRMLLLMETKAIYNQPLFEKIVKDLLKKYLEFLLNDPEKEALFLLNDLIRYFRSIAVNYQYNFWKEEQKWTIRNVKLRHSRVLIYAGLLLLILNASKKRGDKIAYLEENIFLTPIEKIVSVYADNNDFNYKRLLGAYDVFLGKINRKDVRERLKTDYQDRYKNPIYAELKVTSDFFTTELTRFVLTHRNNWTEQIFEYLIF
jgi:hypothetical protein